MNTINTDVMEQMIAFDTQRIFFIYFGIWGFLHLCAYMQLLRPIYKQIAENQNAEIFSANTLLVILGTSLLTARVHTFQYYFINCFKHSTGNAYIGGPSTVKHPIEITEYINL